MLQSNVSDKDLVNAGVRASPNCSVAALACSSSHQAKRGTRNVRPKAARRHVNFVFPEHIFNCTACALKETGLVNEAAHLAELSPGEGQGLQPLLDVSDRLGLGSCRVAGQRLRHIILTATLRVCLQHAEHPGVPLLQYSILLKPLEPNPTSGFAILKHKIRYSSLQRHCQHPLGMHHV